MSGKISLALLASASCLCFASEAFAIDASPAAGPGVIYAGSRDIVTNAHVVANAQTLRVTECPPLKAQAQALERWDKRSL